MNAVLKWKFIAGFLLVFVAGALTGGLTAAAMARHFFFGPPHHGVTAERMRERLHSELKLTPEQMTKISPIVDKTGTQLEQIRAETGRRVHETFQQAHREIATCLTDDQRARMQKMQKRHRRWIQRAHGQEFSPASASPTPHL